LIVLIAGIICIQASELGREVKQASETCEYRPWYSNEANSRIRLLLYLNTVFLSHHRQKTMLYDVIDWILSNKIIDCTFGR